MSIGVVNEKKEYLYKAFISYRHLDFDKNVAIKVQQYLERFKDKSGDKRWRVFRDESELPTSNDLSNDIRNALDNSEFLIVVCSEKTKESRWCTEEVTYFKSLHGNTTKNIFTLLISGNPEDVFIRELCVTNKEFVDEKGNIEIKEVAVEPLAANISAPSEKESFKKLKTEILRIIAPMAGLKYDDLYNRSRRNRNRIVILAVSAVAGVSIAFGLYNSYMLSELKKSNELRDIENAKYLVSQSETLWKNGEFTDAQSTLLRAFPDDHSKVIAEAENLLAQEQGAFEAETLQPIVQCTVSGTINNIFFLSKGTRLVVATDDKAYIFNTGNGEEIACIDLSKFDERGVGIFHSGAYEQTSKWVLPKYSINRLADAELSNNTGAISYYYGTVGSISNYYVSDVDIEEYVQDSDTFYVAFSAEDDELLDESDETTLINDIVYEISAEDGTYIKTNRAALPENTLKEIELTIDYFAEDISGIYGYNLSLGNPSIKIINDNYYAIIPDDAYLSKNITINKYSKDDEEFLDDENSAVWSYTTSFAFENAYWTDFIPKEKSKNYCDVFLLFVGNNVSVLNDTTGEEIKKFTFEDRIVNYYCAENGIAYVYLENGKEYAMYLSELKKDDRKSTHVYLMNDFFFKTYYAAYHKGVYALVNANDVYGMASKNKNITLYTKLKNDNAEVLVSSFENKEDISQRVFNIAGDKMICFGHDVAYLYNFNDGTSRLIYEIKEDEEGYINDAFFVDNDTFVLSYKDYQAGVTNRIYDVTSLEMLNSYMGQETTITYKEISDFAKSGKKSIESFNPFHGFTERIPFNSKYIAMCRDGSRILTNCEKMGYILFDIDTGEDIYLDLPDAEMGKISFNQNCWLSDSGERALVIPDSRSKAYYFSDDGKLINTYELPEENILDVLLFKNNIYMLDENGGVYVSENGGKLSKIEVDYGEDIESNSAKVKYIEKYNYLLAYTGSNTYVIDMDKEKVRFTIEGEVDYSTAIDKFILYDQYRTYAFPVYPVGTIYIDSVKSE